MSKAQCCDESGAPPRCKQRLRVVQVLSSSRMLPGYRGGSFLPPRTEVIALSSTAVASAVSSSRQFSQLARSFLQAVTFFFGSVFRITAAGRQAHWCTESWSPKSEAGAGGPGCLAKKAKPRWEQEACPPPRAGHHVPLFSVPLLWLWLRLLQLPLNSCGSDTACARDLQKGADPLCHCRAWPAALYGRILPRCFQIL